MASIPPLQRRTSPSQRTSPARELESVSQTTSPTASEDSETVIISPSRLREPLRSEPETAQSIVEEPIARARPPPRDEEDVRKCWICFSDETEDTPLSSAWRSPCPCALTAHEACLLDWIADLEAPGSRRSRQGRPQKIECPQCKSEIIIARPRSFVIDGVRGIEDACSRAILPSMLVLSVSSVFRLFYEYGVIAVEVVFGPGDSYQILEPLFEAPLPNQTIWQHMIWSVNTGFRLSLGLVSIPPVLVLSRTAVADGILPILPMLFLATSPKSDALADLGSWPPSAGLSFALLPYVRSVYNFYYDKVWAEKERKWLREIQPRTITGSAEQGDQAEAIPAVEEVLEEEENVIQIDVDFNIVDEWPNGQAIPDMGAPPLNAPPLYEGIENDPEPPQAAAGGQAQNAQQQQGGQNAPAAPAPAEQRGALALNIATNRLADTILGALAYPFVSAAAGDLLRLVLPKAWTAAPPIDRKPTFFLQSRWARSLVGGCLFVVLKDAVMLYVRWRMAQNHRKRRILNYDKVKKKIVYT